MDGAFSFYSTSIEFLLTSAKNICCGYSLEVPHGGTSNEYSQHMLSCRNKKIIYLIHSLI